VETAVEIRGPVKTFGDFRAVDGLDLTVRRGTCHGAVDPNGAGKSATLGMTVGLAFSLAGWARRPAAALGMVAPGGALLLTGLLLRDRREPARR
jgi:ABC-type branched-subunit amino acid transport system ATPase component